MAGGSEFDAALVFSHKFPGMLALPTLNRDAALYVLGVGACAWDAVDEDVLKYFYHKDGQKYIKSQLPWTSKILWIPLDPAFPSSLVLPTFAALFSLGTVPSAGLPGLQYDSRLLLHGQQYIELYKPFPSGGKAAILEIETKSYDKESGDLLCMNRMTGFLRGAGGFSKSSNLFSYSNYPPNQVLVMKFPESQPFSLFEDRTNPSQALLYRLSGDYNPLHSDPMIAKPIFHGLCTLGFAIRAIIKCICRGDLDRIKIIVGRFLLLVYPGETLYTEMWLEGLRVIYRTKVKERKRTVLSGDVDLKGLTPSL